MKDQTTSLKTQKELYSWVEIISNKWQGCTRHFKLNVRDFCGAVVQSGSSSVRGITSLASGNVNSQRRRLQRFISFIDMPPKKTNAVPKTRLENFFVNWSRSVSEQIGGSHVNLIVDETKLKDNYAVMVVGIAYKQRCLPVAWRVYKANSAQDYPAEGQVQLILGLLKQVKEGFGSASRVCVMVDRGIGNSTHLMQGVAALGWTFLFRVSKSATIELPNGERLCPAQQVKAKGGTYDTSGRVFPSGIGVQADVHVVWGKDAKAPWVLVTNHPGITGYEYAERMWIEESFRDLKSHGWCMNEITLKDANRVAALWIILIVAYVWMIMIGVTLEATGLGSCLQLTKQTDPTLPKQVRRRHSLFRQGWDFLRRVTANILPISPVKWQQIQET